MITCPNCSTPLQSEAQDPSRMFCPGCGYRLEGAQTPMPVAGTVQQEPLMATVESEPPYQVASSEPVVAQPPVAAGEDAQQVPLSQQGAPAAQQPGEAPQQPPQQTAIPQQAPMAQQPPMASQQAMPQQGMPGVQPGSMPPQAQQADYWGTKGTGPAAVQAQQAGQPMAMAPAQPGKGMAVTALVLGILAILGCWIPFLNVGCIVLGVVAIILGFMTMSRVKRGVAAGRSFGLAGAILGIVSVVLSIVVSVCATLLVSAAYDYGYDYEDALESVLEGSGSQRYDDGHHYGSDSISAQGGANDGAWSSLGFTMDGGSFKLGETTLEDFEAKTGWAIDLDAAGYPNGYIVQAGEDITSIGLSNASHPDDYLSVDVANNGKDQRDLKKCTLCEIVVQASGEGTLAFTLEGGIGLGSTLEEARGAYGKPSYDYESSDGPYKSITYYDASYDKEAELTATKGTAIDIIELSLD